MPTNLLTQIIGASWLITEPAMQSLLITAQNVIASPAQATVVGDEGQWLKGTHSTEVHGSVAVITVSGPLFRFSSVWQREYSIAGYDRIAKDFKTALDDQKIESIVFDFDCPGGMVTGLSLLCSQIYNARGVKPIVAFGTDRIASAGYWLASACDRIVVSDTAEVGCLGTQKQAISVEKLECDMGVERLIITSEQTPNKNLSPFTEAGKADWQSNVNDLSQVFLESVARNRGITLEAVNENYGQGATFIGQKAVDAGLADSVGTLVSLLAELNKQSTDSITSTGSSLAGTNAAIAGQPQQEAIMPKEQTALSQATLEQLTEENPALVAQIQSAAASGERNRISAILQSDSAKAHPDTAMALAMKADMDAETANGVLATLPEPVAASAEPSAAATPTQTPFEAHMQSVGDPQVDDDAAVGGQTEQTDDEKAVAKAISGAAAMGLDHLLVKGA